MFIVTCDPWSLCSVGLADSSPRNSDSISFPEPVSVTGFAEGPRLCVGGKSSTLGKRLTQHRPPLPASTSLSAASGEPSGLIRPFLGTCTAFDMPYTCMWPPSLPGIWQSFSKSPFWKSLSLQPYVLSVLVTSCLPGLLSPAQAAAMINCHFPGTGRNSRSDDSSLKMGLWRGSKSILPPAVAARQRVFTETVGPLALKVASELGRSSEQARENAAELTVLSEVQPFSLDNCFLEYCKSLINF